MLKNNDAYIMLFILYVLLFNNLINISNKVTV